MFQWSLISFKNVTINHLFSLWVQYGLVDHVCLFLFMRITLLVESEFAFHLVRITCFISLGHKYWQIHVSICQYGSHTISHFILFYQYMILNQSNSVFFFSLIFIFCVLFNQTLIFFGGSTSTVASASVFSF
jgi:hypothetical protein